MTPSAALARGLLFSLTLGLPVIALATDAPPKASVYFISPQNGDAVTNPFTVRFGLRGMGVAPAGVDKPNTGHHHLLIDTTLSPEQLTQPIVNDAQHLHFGGGQTETELTLPRGRHTLQLVLGDWSHIPFNPSIVSSVITITVKTGEDQQ
jgi:Domain of unknown function (DUF4399)